MEDTTAFLNGDLFTDNATIIETTDKLWQSSAMDSVRPKRGSQEQARKFFSTLVLNLVLAGDEALAVPRDRAARDYQPGRYNTKGLTLNSIKYQQRLVDAGMLQMAKGSFEEGKCTTVRPLGPLHTLVEALTPLSHLIIDGLERIEVRGRGRRIDYDDNQNTITWRETLRAHADLMGSVEVTVRLDGNEEPTLIPPQAMGYRRLFARGSWDCGGRLYCHNIQNLRRKSVKERQTITFDGKATVEPDFSGQHPRMLYIMEGSPRSADEDMYSAWSDVELPSGTELSAADRRALAKLLMLCSFNAATPGEACSAVREKMNGYGHKISRADVNTLYVAMTNHHSTISHHFGSDKGVRLQRVDSDIMLLVMAEMTHRRLPCLSVHDSLICKEDDQRIAVSLMAAASAFYLGHPLPVDADTAVETLSLMSPLFKHEQDVAQYQQVPLGVLRLRVQPSPIEECASEYNRRVRHEEKRRKEVVY